jgi:hypothetical protein
MLAHTANNDVLNERLQSGTPQRLLNVGKWALAEWPEWEGSGHSTGRRRLLPEDMISDHAKPHEKA